LGWLRRGEEGQGERRNESVKGIVYLLGQGCVCWLYHLGFVVLFACIFPWKGNGFLGYLVLCLLAFSLVFGYFFRRDKYGFFGDFERITLPGIDIWS
jgi:hypothetical protein